jgi:hypothetical protein
MKKYKCLSTSYAFYEKGKIYDTSKTTVGFWAREYPKDWEETKEEKSFPKKWCLHGSEELEKYFSTLKSKDFGECCLSGNAIMEYYYLNSNKKWEVSSMHWDRTLITFEQFKHNILNKSKDMPRKRNSRPLINKEIEEVKLLKSNVLKAAKNHPEAEKVLKELMPDIFKDEFDLTKLKLDPAFSKSPYNYGFFTRKSGKISGFKNNGVVITIRSFGKYKDKAFLLDSNYNWKILQEGNSYLLLPENE